MNSNIIGLNKGAVELFPHNPKWHEIANCSILELKEILGSITVDIQHIGSTAIRGIYAKPIIDIIVGIKKLDDITRPKLLTKLEEIGYVYKPVDDCNWRRYFRKESNNLRTHHIHAVIHLGKEWNDHILFRDFLNSNPEWAKIYEELKLSLMEKYKFDRESYTNGKSDQIAEILEAARGL